LDERQLIWRFIHYMLISINWRLSNTNYFSISTVI